MEKVWYGNIYVSMCQILDMDIVKLLSKKKKYELSHFGLDICVYGYILIYYGYILIFVKYWIWIWQIYWGWKSMSNCCIWVSSPPSSLYPTLKSASQRISKDCKDNLNLSIKLQSVQHPSITDFIPQQGLPRVMMLTPYHGFFVTEQEL